MHSEVNSRQFNPSSRTQNRFTNLIKALCLTTLLTQQIANAIPSNQVTTTYDGVTPDRYIQYLKFDGTNGVTLPISDGSSLNTNLEYTFMLWFKPMTDSWGNQLQYAFRFPASFQCYFSAAQSLICESQEQSDKLITSTTGVYQNQWAHVTVSGHPQIGSYVQLESHTDLVSSDSKSYVIFRQPSWGWTACLGNCNSNFGFKGGMREFIYLNQYLTPQTAQRIKNHYLTWDSSIKAYYRFQNPKFFNKDEFRSLYAGIDTTVKQEIDYISNDICYPPLWSYDPFLNFNKDGLLRQASLDGKWNPKNTGYEYSVSLWVRISPDSCTQSSPLTAKSSCFLFKLDEVMMLYLDKKGSAKFYFFALQNFYESQSSSMFVPENQWVNIQIVMGQYLGYEIRQYDMLGRMTYYEKISQDMQEQRASKTLDLFSGFRGQAKHFIFFTEKRTLPIVPPLNNARIEVVNCLVYFIFQPSFISGTTLNGQGVNSINMQLSSTPTYEYKQWQSIPFNSGSTGGLVTYPAALFDGIACNDNFNTLQFITKQSSVQATTAPVTQWLNATTIEFWFRPVAIVNQTDYLFSLWGNSSAHEFFSIYLDTNKVLICGPFGIDSSRSTYVSYLDYTETNRQVYRWFHITCQYEYQKEITGYLYNGPLMDQKYVTTLAQDPSYIPADTFKVILGNNNSFNRSTPLLFMKEVRVWPYKRAYSDIAEWRFRQLDPNTQINGQKMLTYLRLSGAAYNDYNYVNGVNGTLPSDVIFNSISYSTNQEITICPQQTFYMGAVCYLNPIKVEVPAVFPDFDNVTSTLYWIITGNHSSLINPAYISSVQMQWNSEDPVLSSFIANDTTKYDLRIPAKALRDGSPYRLKLNVTTPARTFVEQQTISFVPISCKYYTVSGSDAFSFYNNYQFSQASNDIQFNIVYNELQPYCNDVSFYNTLQPNVTYTIIPPPAQMPVISFVFNSDKSITVVIPKGEQSKLATKTDIKILFQIYYTNSQYKQLMTTSEFHFQDVMYTLNFNYEQQTVIAKLNTNSQAVLNNETLVLNASDTYITGFSNGNQGSLQFQWICDGNFSSICSSTTGPVLSVAFSDFVAVSAQYNRTYQFQVQVVWTHVDGAVERFFATQSVQWYNIMSPQFNFVYPNPIKSTAEQQQFLIQFASYATTNLASLQITWSIVPNLTLPSYYNFTLNSTLLTVPKGGFNSMTNYTVTVVVQNKMAPIATKQKSVNFMTQQAPFGGSALITPTSGFLNSTTFTVTISNWQSINRPIQYRVWSTTTYLGNEVKDLLTTGWVAEATAFNFQAQATNPLQVEISDTSLESAFVKLSPSISAQTAKLNQMLTQAVAVEDDYSLKYTYLSAIVNAFQSIEQSSTNETAASQQQLSYIQTLLDSIQKDLLNVNNSKSIENGDSYTVTQNSVTMLSQMLQDPTNTNDQIIESSLQILDTVQSTSTVFNQLILESPDFSQSYALALSYILKYSDKKAYTVFNNRLLSTNTDTQQGILDMNARIKNTKNKLMGYICNSTIANIQIQEIVTQAFDLQVQKFSLDTHTSNASYSFREDQKTQLKVNVADIVNQAISQNILSQQSSFCVMTTHYKLNLNPLSKVQRSQMSQYASSFMDFTVTDETGQRQLNDISMKSASSIQFNIATSTFKNNQTMCMAYSATQGWSSNPCQTVIDVEGQFVNCQCNMIDNQLYTLFTDTTRLQAEPLFVKEEESKAHYDKIISQYMADSSISYLGIILVLVSLGLGLTVASIVLDKNDKKAYQKQSESTQKFEMLKQVAALSSQPLGLWIYKQDSVIAYSIPNRSNFSHMLSLHPIFSILSKFDIKEARLTRFSLYFLQVSAYALFCISIFGGKYRNDDQSRNDTVIDEQDIGAIFALGIVGMLFLLPIPYSNKLFKASVSEKNQDKNAANQINNHSVSVNPNYHNEQTQEQNILQNSPHQIVRRQEDSDTQVFKRALEDLVVVNKHKYVRIAILVSAYAVALTAIIVAISINSQLSLSNQYCTVATFYFGFFGSMFVTNILRILFNSVLAGTVSNNERSLLRFVVSSDAVQIMKERQLVKQAEKQLSFKPSQHQETDQSVHKTEQDEVIAPIHMNEIDMNGIHDNDLQEQSHYDDVASISHNNDEIAQSVSKYLQSASPKRSSNYRIKSQEDAVRRSIDIFERAKNSNEKSEVRYSCVTENNFSHQKKKNTHNQYD